MSIIDKLFFCSLVYCPSCFKHIQTILVYLPKKFYIPTYKNHKMKTFKKTHLLFFIVFLISNAISSQSINLISYNIKYDHKNDTLNNWQDRKQHIITLIEQYNPSIFGIQEGLINQVKFLDNSLTNYTYVGHGRDGKTQGEYSAIFYDSTKFKVKKNHTFWLSQTPDSISKGWDAALNRICTYALFENLSSKKRLWVFNTHFDHIGELARENSAQLILDIIEQINTLNFPIVLMGDFNALPKEKPIQLLKTQLNDGLKLSEKPLIGPTGTFNGFNKNPVTKRIDYFFTKNVAVNSYEHIDDLLNNKKHISDHLPILITINY